MNIKIKVVSLLLAMVMVCGMLGGCSRLGGIKTDDYSKVAVASYGDSKIYLDEVNFFARKSQYVYEMYYGTDIWSNESYAEIADFIKQNAVSTLYQTEVLADKAAELGITLSDEDKAKVDTAVSEFFEHSDEKLKKACNITEERLKEIYTKNALANRVYESTYADKDISVTDEEAAQRTVEYILVPASESKEKAEEILKTVSEGADMKETSETNNMSFSTISFGKGDYENEIGTVSDTMKDGDYAIAEVENDGWYVMHMVSAFDETATANKKTSMESSKKTEIFKEVYAKWLEGGKKFKVDEDILDVIKFTSPIYEAPVVQSTEAASEAVAESSEAAE